MKKSSAGIVKILCQPSTYPEEPFYVAITDCESRWIAGGYTDARGCAVFKISSRGKYRIVVSSPPCFGPQAAYRWVRLCPDNCYTLFYVFNKKTEQPVLTDVTIRAADTHYSNYVFEGVTFNLGL